MNRADLMRKDVQTLLKRRDTLNQREALTIEDIKKICKTKNAINAFDWTAMVNDAKAFNILEEIKQQLEEGFKIKQQTKERNEGEGSNASDNQQGDVSREKDPRKIMMGQARILSALNQITVEMGVLQNYVQEIKENATSIVVQGDQLQNLIDGVGIDSENNEKSEDEEANIDPEQIIKTEDDEMIDPDFFVNPELFE